MATQSIYGLSRLQNMFQSIGRFLVGPDRPRPTTQELIDLEFMRLEREVNADASSAQKKLYEEYRRGRGVPPPKVGLDDGPR
jgi:hypothetical protein